MRVQSETSCCHSLATLLKPSPVHAVGRHVCIPACRAGAVSVDLQQPASSSSMSDIQAWEMTLHARAWLGLKAATAVTCRAQVTAEVLLRLLVLAQATCAQAANGQTAADADSMWLSALPCPNDGDEGLWDCCLTEAE